MSTLTAGKLIHYGAVCFIPSSSFDTVSGSMTYAGQALSLLEPSEQLPGYLGWFTISNMNDPSLAATDPGLDTTGNEPVQLKAKKNGKKEAKVDEPVSE